MAAGTFTLYNGVSEYLGDGTVDMDNDTFNITLHTSTYTPAGTQDAYANLTNELGTANGYTAGGAALTTVTWTRATGVTKFDIVARYAVIRSTTADKLIGYYLLDDTPADLTATDGNTFTVGPNASTGWSQHSVNA